MDSPERRREDRVFPIAPKTSWSALLDCRRDALTYVAGEEQILSASDAMPKNSLHVGSRRAHALNSC
jgi:hypothetical protein